MGMRHGWDQYPALIRVGAERAEPVRDLSVETLVQDWEAEVQALGMRRRFRLLVATPDHTPLRAA
jgi:hypothetical protein